MALPGEIELKSCCCWWCTSIDSRYRSFRFSHLRSTRLLIERRFSSNLLHNLGEKRRMGCIKARWLARFTADFQRLRVHHGIYATAEARVLMLRSRNRYFGGFGAYVSFKTLPSCSSNQCILQQWVLIHEVSKQIFPEAKFREKVSKFSKFLCTSLSLGNDEFSNLMYSFNVQLPSLVKNLRKIRWNRIGEKFFTFL